MSIVSCGWQIIELTLKWSALCLNVYFGFPLQSCLFLGLNRVKVKEGLANFPVSGFWAVDLTVDFPLRSKPAAVWAHSWCLLWRCVAALFAHLEFLEDLVSSNSGRKWAGALSLAGNSSIFHVDWHPAHRKRPERLNWSNLQDALAQGGPGGTLLSLVDFPTHKWMTSIQPRYLDSNFSKQWTTADDQKSYLLA